jgi:hypothetical protein
MNRNILSAEKPNNLVQAIPVFALLFIVRQLPGPPDQYRYTPSAT